MKNNRNITIRPMNMSDWAAVSQIYLDGIATGVATFEKIVPSYESWNAAHLNTCRLIAEKNNSVKAWGCTLPCFKPMCLRWGGRS